MSLRPPAARESRLQAVLRAGAAWVGTPKRTRDEATATDAPLPPTVYFGYYKEIEDGSISEQLPLDRDGNVSETRPTRGEVLAQLNGGATFNFSNNCSWGKAFDTFKSAVRHGQPLAVVFTAAGEALAIISLNLMSSVRDWTIYAKRLQALLPRIKDSAELASEVEDSEIAFNIDFACSSGSFKGTRPDGSPAWRGVMRYLLSEMAHVIRALYSPAAAGANISDRLFMFTLSSRADAEAIWSRLGFVRYYGMSSALRTYYRPVFGPEASPPTPKSSTMHLGA